MVGLRLLRCKHWFFVVVVLLPPSPVYAQSVDAALAALARGDHAAALKWYRLAAVQGNAGAQRHLGELYYDGLGVTQDTARAYVWLHLAAAAGDARAARYRDLAARRLKPSQVAEAQKVARACQLKAFAGCS